MSDEFTLNVALLTGTLVVVSLFVSLHFMRDPMVRPLPLLFTPSLMTLHGHVSSLTLSQP